MPALDAAERGTAASKRPASQDAHEPERRWRWPGSIGQFSTHLDQNRAPQSGKQEHLSIGPEDPCKWPPERICFILGIMCFPLWVLGAFWRWREEFEPFADLHKWRCQVMLMMASVIATGLAVVQVTFRET